MEQNNQNRLDLEPLEDRLTPAITWSIAGGVLYVSGDEQNNTIVVQVFNNTITLQDGGKVIHTRPVQSVTGVVVGGFGGNDILFVGGDDSLARLSKVSLLGGLGNDSFFIDSRALRLPAFDLAGQDGHDTLVISQCAPREGRVQGLEDLQLSRLAAAQIELRDREKHPEMGNLYLPLRNPPGSLMLTSNPGARDGMLTRDILLQFEVDRTERYRKGTNRNNDTRCNLYVGDVLKVMNAALPTKAEFNKGGDKSMWVGAQDAHRWLNGSKGTGTLGKSGPQQGWVKVDPRTPAGMAQLLAHVQAGKPAVASTPDHIAFIRPDQVGATHTTYGDLYIAQAGSKNFTVGKLTDGWPASRLKEIQFFLHA